MSGVHKMKLINEHDSFAHIVLITCYLYLLNDQMNAMNKATLAGKEYSILISVTDTST